MMLPTLTGALIVVCQQLLSLMNLPSTAHGLGQAKPLRRMKLSMAMK